MTALRFQTRGKNKKYWQKNERGDGKGESNDSPEITDMSRTSDTHGLPLGEMKGM